MYRIQGKKIFVHDYLEAYEKAKEQANKENVAPVVSPASFPDNPRPVAKRKLNAPEMNTKYDIKNSVHVNLDAKKPRKGESIDSSLVQKNVITNSDKTLRNRSTFEISYTYKLLFSSSSKSSNSTTSTTDSSNAVHRQNGTKFAAFTSNNPNLDLIQSYEASKFIQSKKITPNTATTRGIEENMSKPTFEEWMNSTLNIPSSNQKQSDAAPKPGHSKETSQNAPTTKSINGKNESKQIDRQSRTKFASFTSNIPKKQNCKASKLIQPKQISTPNTTTKKSESVNSPQPQKNVICNSDKMLRRFDTYELLLNSEPPNRSNGTKYSGRASKLTQSKEIITLRPATKEKVKEKNSMSTFEDLSSKMLSLNQKQRSTGLKPRHSEETRENSEITRSINHKNESKNFDRQNKTRSATFTSNIPNLHQKQNDNVSKLIRSKEICTLNPATKRSDSVKSPLVQKNVITNSDKTLRRRSTSESYEILLSSGPSNTSNSTNSTTHSSKGVDSLQNKNKTKFRIFASNNIPNLDDKALKLVQPKEISTEHPATTKKVEEEKNDPSYEDFINSIFSPKISNQKQCNIVKNEPTFEQIMNAIFSPNIPNLGRRATNPKLSSEISTQTSFGDSILELITPPSSQNKEVCSQTSSSHASTQTITETQGHDDMELTQNFAQMTTSSESFSRKSFNNQETSSSQLSQTSTQQSIQPNSHNRVYLPYSEPSVASFTQETSSQLSQASTQRSVQPNSDNRDHFPYSDLSVVSLTQETSSQLSQASVEPSQINSDNDGGNANEDLNILQVLGDDVILTPENKFKFNNIAKIGTEKWLQFAQTAIAKHKDQLKKTEVELVHNSFDDVYSNNLVKQKVKCYREGNIRIYKLENMESCDEETFSVNLSFEDLEESSQGERNLRIGIDEILKDKNLICTEQSRTIDKGKIKSIINDIFVKLYSIYENGKIPRVCVLGSFTPKHCIFEDGRLKLNPLFKRRTFVKKAYTITNSKNLYLTFCRMLFLMGKVYSLLETNKQLTKRELFYEVKHLVKSQSQVNAAIQMMSIFLNVGDWHLNIISTSGVVYGNLKLVWSSGKVTNCNVPATMIPPNADDISEFHTNAYFILVVEKEAIFQKLIQEDLPNKLARPFILITGKGFPCFNTQLFLKKLSTVMALPVFILVDGDVHGIRIMLQYRFGSCRNCHLSEYLAVPNIRWLGVFPSEINTLGIKNSPLTNREKNSINCLLKYPYMESVPKITEEVKFLLNNNKKASIEGLIKNDNFLSGFYLPTKLNNRDFL